jgi:ABC-type nitrate/sulfonate/bicarbonate transport system permease component
MTGRQWASGVGGLLVCLAVWQVLVGSGLVEYDLLPSPWTIAGGLATMVAEPAFAIELGHTLAATLIGWLLAVLAGTASGALLGTSARARRYCLASIEVLRPLPAVAFVPVALLLFGFSLQMELLVIVAPALWPALVNTMEGFAGVPQRLSDVAATFHLSAGTRLMRVYLPAAAPAVLVGMRLSLSLALVMAVVAEMVGNPEGLGYALVREQQALHPDLMFGYVLVIGVVGMVLNGLLVLGSRFALPGLFRRPAARWDSA